MGFKVAKFDVAKEEPVRGKDGFCREAQYGQVGELLGPIIKSDPLKNFDGYHGNKAASDKKVLRNAFKKGDAYFRTGPSISAHRHRHPQRLALCYSCCIACLLSLLMHLKLSICIL